MSQFCAKHRLGPRPDTQLGDESLSGHMDRVVVADGPPPLDDADKVLSLQVCLAPSPWTMQTRS